MANFLSDKTPAINNIVCFYARVMWLELHNEVRDKDDDFRMNERKEFSGID